MKRKSLLIALLPIRVSYIINKHSVFAGRTQRYVFEHVQVAKRRGNQAEKLFQKKNSLFTRSVRPRSNMKGPESP